MKKRMAEINAPIAGEMSGHIFIADDFYGYDDALYVATRVISQMVRTGQSITDFVDRLPDQHATPELHIPCSDTEKFPLMERLSTFAKSHHDPTHLTLIDGVRVRTIDGWWLVQPQTARWYAKAALSMLLTDLLKILRRPRRRWPRLAGKMQDESPGFIG